MKISNEKLEIQQNELLPFIQLKSQRDKIVLTVIFNIKLSIVYKSLIKKREIKDLFNSYFFEITGNNYECGSFDNLNFGNKYEKWGKNIIKVLLGLQSQSTTSSLNLWKS